jgi:nickel-dependent lactate racemase
VPPDLIVDVTLDAANQITGVFAGELESAWRAGVAFAADHVRACVPEPVDIVVTTCAGWPLDATFYQAVKGMVGALPIVKPGGSIVIASECSEGIGGEVFSRTLLETDDLFALVDAMQKPGWTYLPDQWEVEELAKAVRNNTVYCVCDPRAIPPDTLARLFVTPAASVEQAVAAALAVHGPDATLAVIPKGPYVIPYVASAGR